MLVPAGWAQSFLVKPMSAELSAKQGSTFDLVFDVTNTAPDRKQTVDIRAMRLGQNDAGWVVFEESEATADVKSKFASCLTWLRVDRAALEIDAGQTASVKVRMTVPSSARGFYSAALVIESQRPPGTGVGIIVRFLIPIMVQIEGTVPTRSAKVIGASAKYAPPEGSNPGGVTVGALVLNNGQTLNRTSGNLSLYAKVGTQWVRVSSAESSTKRILPGGAVYVTAPIPKKIPSGTYRVDADISIEGRRLPKYSQEIQIEGDKNVGSITPDASLIPTPEILEVDGAPGSTRAMTVSLRNPTESPIDVRLSVMTPPLLQGVALGSITGQDYSAADWTTVAPETITIAPNQERKVQVLVKVPDGANLPFYYASIMAAISRGGEPAGTASVLAIAANKGAPTLASIKEAAKVSVSKGEGDSYLLAASFANHGNQHERLASSFVVTDMGGVQTLLEVPAEADSSLALPLGIVRMSGSLEAKKLKPGSYILRAVCRFGTQTAVSQVPITVVTSASGNAIQVGSAPATKQPANAKSGGKAPAATKPAGKDTKSKTKTGGTAKQRST